MSSSESGLLNENGKHFVSYQRGSFGCSYPGASWDCWHSYWINSVSAAWLFVEVVYFLQCTAVCINNIGMTTFKHSCSFDFSIFNESRLRSHIFRGHSRYAVSFNWPSSLVGTVVQCSDNAWLVVWVKEQVLVCVG